MEEPLAKLTSEGSEDIEPVSTSELLSRSQTDEILSEGCHSLQQTFPYGHVTI